MPEFTSIPPNFISVKRPMTVADVNEYMEGYSVGTTDAFFDSETTAGVVSDLNLNAAIAYTVDLLVPVEINTLVDENTILATNFLLYTSFNESLVNDIVGKPMYGFDKILKAIEIIESAVTDGAGDPLAPDDVFVGPDGVSLSYFSDVGTIPEGLNYTFDDTGDVAWNGTLEISIGADGTFTAIGDNFEAGVGFTDRGKPAQVKQALEDAIDEDDPTEDLEDFLIIRGVTATFLNFDPEVDDPPDVVIMTNYYAYGLRKIFNLD